MCRVKAKVRKGIVPSERVAYIETASGSTSEVIVSRSQTGRGCIKAAEIGRDKNMVLIELPMESTAGDWRIWVKSRQIL